MTDGLDAVGDGFRGLADEGEADAEDDGEEQHLEHVVAGQRVERGGGNDVEDEAADAGALELAGVVGVGGERVGVEAGGVDVHALARADHEGEDEADDQGDGGHHLEVEQRLAADAAHLAQIAGAGDAVHDHAEHDGRHDHRDQLEKGVAEHLEADGESGSDDAEHHAEHQRHDDLHEQGGVERLRLGRGSRHEGWRGRAGHRRSSNGDPVTGGKAERQETRQRRSGTRPTKGGESDDLLLFSQRIKEAVVGGQND